MRQQMVGGGDLTLQHFGWRRQRPAAGSKNGLGFEAAAKQVESKLNTHILLQIAKKYTHLAKAFQMRPGSLSSFSQQNTVEAALP
jgi:hypothetical protein